MPSDAACCAGQIAAVVEHRYQWDSYMCETIQLTGTSMFIIIITLATKTIDE
jgi:hypothetical protein